MPEGDSAYRVARTLREYFSGSLLTEFQIRTAGLAEVNLSGETVRDVAPFGKHVFIRIGERSVHSHMLMDGVWHVYRRGARWRRPAHQARIVLGTAQHQAVGFLLAQIKVIPTDRESEIIGHLGPDPLKPEWGKGGWRTAVANVKADTRPIHVALLDQRNVAGFGNEYANEICFLGGVDPSTPAAEVDVERLLRLGARLIVANKDRVERTTTGNLRPGQRLHVYGRVGQACGRCGTAVRFTRLGARAGEERLVYWCPTCQPTPHN